MPLASECDATMPTAATSTGHARAHAHVRAHQFLPVPAAPPPPLALARARSRCLGRSVRVGNGNLAYFSQQAGKGYRARVRQAGRLTQPEPVSPSVCLAGGCSATTACWMNFDVLFRMERIIISLLLHTTCGRRATCGICVGDTRRLLQVEFATLTKLLSSLLYALHLRRPLLSANN